MRRQVHELHFTRRGFGGAIRALIEFSFRRSLFRTYAACSYIGREIIFTLDWRARHPAEHCDLAYVGQSIGDGSLK